MSPKTLHTCLLLVLTLPALAQTGHSLREIREMYAEGAYSQAFDGLRLWEGNPDSLGVSDALFYYSTEGHRLRISNKVAEACRAYGRIADLPLGRLSDDERLEAWSLLGLSAIIRNDPERAASWLDTLVAAGREVENIPPKAGMRMVVIRASLAGREGKDAERRSRLENALRILYDNELERDPETAFVLRALGRTARGNSEFDAAIRYFESELSIWEEIVAADHVAAAITHYNIGNVHYEMLAFEEALNHYLQALPAFARGDVSASYRRYLQEAIGDMYFELEQKGEAARYWAAASEDFIPASHDRLDQMWHTVDSLEEVDRHDLALQAYRDALAFRMAEYGQDHYLTAECQTYLSRALLNKGDYRKAARSFHNSLRIFLPWFRDTSILAVPDSLPLNTRDRYLYDALLGKTVALYRLYGSTGSESYLEAAYRTAGLSFRMLGGKRQLGGEESSKLFWSGRAVPLIETSLSICRDFYERTGDPEYIDSAFRFMELGKGTLLRYALQQSEFLADPAVPAELREEEASLRAQIGTYEARIQQEEKRCEDARGEKVSAWTEQLILLRNRYNALLETLEKGYPRYFDLKYGRETTGISGVQGWLPGAGQALASYFLGSEELFILLVRAEEARLFRVPLPDDFADRLDRFRRSISDPAYFQQHPDSARRSFGHTGHALYRLLLEPLADDLAVDSVLYILPDAQLYRLPFECLPTRDPGGDPDGYQDVPFALHRYHISYANSATLLCNDHREGRRRQSGSFFLGMAPSFAEDGVARRESAGALLFNEEEVREASRYFPSRLLIGRKATKSGFLREAGEAGILHLATHAEADDRYPLLSHIHFQPEGPDSLLYAHELYGMRLNADLAVLSACNTGAGLLASGEGVMSLSRGFRYAGCPAVLMSQWTVDDRASAELMGEWYRLLSQGIPKNVALSRAKRNFLASADPVTSHPYFWAGFTLVGDPSPVPEMEGGGRKWLLYVGVSLALILLFTLAMRRRFFPGL